MFGKWFKKKADEPTTQNTERENFQNSHISLEVSAYLQRNNAAPQLEYDLQATADKARARARYELAGRLMSEYADWYRINIVDDPNPRDSDDTRKKFRDYLEAFQATPSQMVLAAADRDAVVAFVHSAGNLVSRQQIEEACPIHWDVKYGVFLNQLVRGNWLNETGEGKGRRYTLSSAKRVSDDEFLKTERVGA